MICNALAAAALGAALLSSCSQPPEPQQTSVQSTEALEQQIRKDADEKAWAEASRAGTAAAITAYLQTHGSGAHAAEARKRLAALEEQIRKDTDEKAWAEASRAGTAGALTAYLQSHGSGAHAAEARKRLAALEQQARKDTDEKAWAEASRAGTAAAITAYLETHGSGAHAAEARQRLAALEQQARKDADEKAWAEASGAGTAAALSAYLQTHGSGAHVAEARQRLAVLEEQARKKDDTLRQKKALALRIPNIDIRKICQARAAALESLQDKGAYDGCIKGQLSARDDIVKRYAEFTASERGQCMNPKVYMPSYVEWLTCLEMQRDVRNLRKQEAATKKQEATTKGQR